MALDRVGYRWAGAWLFLGLTLALGACGGDDNQAPQSDVHDDDVREEVHEDVSDEVDTTPDPDTGEDVDPSDTDEGDVSDVEEEEVVELELPPRPWSVYASGPFRSGFRIERGHTYIPRGDEEERRIRFSMWYPTHARSGEIARYVNSLLAQRNRPVHANAPLARNAGDRLPVLIFSHGNSSLAEQSFFMTEFFATHGWVVISPDHTGNTFFDNQGAINIEAAYVRPQDLSYIIDYLETLPEDHFLYGRLDLDSIVVSGHSFGGFTTLAIGGGEFAVEELTEDCGTGAVTGRYCTILGSPQIVEVFREGLGDPRVRVAIPQTPAGAQVFREGLEALQIPTLLMTGALDRSTSNAEEGDPIWNYMRGSQHMRLDLERGGHFTFSNMCDFFGFTEQIADDGCSEGFIPATEAYDIINAYAMAFVRLHLFGDDAYPELLYNDESPFEGVRISLKPEDDVTEP